MSMIGRKTDGSIEYTLNGKCAVCADKDAEISHFKEDLQSIIWERDDLLERNARLKEEVEMWKDANAEGYEQLKRLCEENNRLTKLNLSTICAYCGTFFEADADGRKVDALQEHMKVCPNHPMRKLEQALAAAEAREKELREKVERAREWTERMSTINEYRPRFGKDFNELKQILSE